ncbi:MAG TPA: hypothetical protein VNL91_09145 [Thermoanaerobaculia bacterium]|nr:hypothetical protein [Thermoanaerobaculia bacterium]
MNELRPNLPPLPPPRRSKWRPPVIEKACTDCGKVFAARFAKFCRDCTYKPGNRRGVKTKKYVWTAERDAFLRKNYDSSVRGRAAQIARTLGWPKWVILKRAGQLGIREPWPKDRRGWDESELQFLLDHLGQRTPLWIAKRLKRSETSVVMKAKRLRLSRRFDDGTYTGNQVCEGFGVDHHVVDRWIRLGWLDAVRRGSDRPNDAWRIKPEAVRRFVRKHPTEFDIRKVDQVWFLDVVLGVQGETGREASE